MFTFRSELSADKEMCSTSNLDLIFERKSSWTIWKCRYFCWTNQRLEEIEDDIKLLEKLNDNFCPNSCKNIFFYKIELKNVQDFNELLHFKALGLFIELRLSSWTAEGKTFRIELSSVGPYSQSYFKKPFRSVQIEIEKFMTKDTFRSFT